MKARFKSFRTDFEGTEVGMLVNTDGCQLQLSLTSSADYYRTDELNFRACIRKRHTHDFMCPRSINRASCKHITHYKLTGACCHAHSIPCSISDSPQWWGANETIACQWHMLLVTALQSSTSDGCMQTPIVQTGFQLAALHLHSLDAQSVWPSQL